MARARGKADVAAGRLTGASPQTALQWLAIIALTATGRLIGDESRASAQSFVNFEVPHVHPLDITPDGALLLAVNTPDNRLEVFTLTSQGPVRSGSVPVGLEPVTVRAFSATEAWVVNHISDSISIIDLPTLRVRATLNVGDEPTDVVFAGKPLKAFVSLSQLNQARVFDPLLLEQLGEPISIQGEEPRALATDGTRVFAAIFNSGNQTTIVPRAVVSSGASPYPTSPNPPPNSGVEFEPPIANELTHPPPGGLIVKLIDDEWSDDNPQAPGKWNAAVSWVVHDHDVAVIEADTLAVSYLAGFMNLNMAVALRSDGMVCVVGTDAINHVRFEPRVRGVFVRTLAAAAPVEGGSPVVVDLNPHLDYSTATISQDQRDLSVGDPRGLVWNVAGDVGYVTGMGSNNLIVIDGAFNRIATVEVGQGPTGVRLDEPRDLIYVQNKFDATISVIGASSLSIVETLSIHDPTPQAIKLGRPHLYDTHKNSGLGQASCASCHVDGRTDQLAWDLGDPSGEMKPFNQSCQSPIPGQCENWHPMKGPLLTQTLIGTIGTEPLHWRGDRENLAAFNGAFVSLLGDDDVLTTQEMMEFSNFVATLRFPPQPNRTIFNALPTSASNGGNPQMGQTRFTTQPINGAIAACSVCHALPKGTNGQITPAAAIQSPQSFKIPQLRDLYERSGFDRASPDNVRGFGFMHDGSTDTLMALLQNPRFVFSSSFGDPMQQRRDIEAFLLAFPSGTHAAIGVQTTIVDSATIPPQQQETIDALIALAETSSIGLVVTGRLNGEMRGWRYDGGNVYQSDRAAQTATHQTLLALAAPGSELTFTAVPPGSQTRIGLDRDLDGFFNCDETDGCSDPADALSTPDSVCLADVAPDGIVDVMDLLLVINNWGMSGEIGTVPGDIDPDCGDGVVSIHDLLGVINGWGNCP